MVFITISFEVISVVFIMIAGVIAYLIFIYIFGQQCMSEKYTAAYFTLKKA